MTESDSASRITAFLSRHDSWRTQLEAARTVLLRAGLDESIKWGGPAYSLDGRVLVGLAGFKRHCAIWFHQGVFLADEAKVLQNAQTTTRGMRQWRFEEGDKVPKRLLQRYVRETIDNERAGKRIKPQARKNVDTPPELSAALNSNKKLAAAFAGLTPGRQREYAEHVAGAKREATRHSRVEKILPRILAGEGLNDAYR